MSAIDLPRLYPIIDVACFSDRADLTSALLGYARALIAGGATLIQYRNKHGSAREMLSHARELRRLAGDLRLIMNDRADLCLASGFDGVHIGQDDLSPEGVRLVVGPERWVGVSTHNPVQVRQVDGWPVDYVAVGPVFATTTKTNPDPVIGLEGVRAARELTRKPLVAIGGITRADCRAVIEAGADSVAVISDLLREPSKAVEEFLRLM